MAQGRICVYVLRVSFGIGRLDDFSVLFTKSYHNSLTEREMERDIDRKRERDREWVTQQKYGRITSNVQDSERRTTKA